MDATAGRLLRLTADGGSFGVGNSGVLEAVSDMDDITLPGGFHRIGPATTGTRPAGFSGTSRGTLIVLRESANTASQILVERIESQRLYRRAYEAGSWGAWAADITSGDNANGTYTRLTDGTLRCRHRLDATYANAGSLEATWTYPAAFDGNAVIGVAVGGAGNATPTNAEIAQALVLGNDATSATISVTRATGATNFQAGDTIEVHVTAEGRAG